MTVAPEPYNAPMIAILLRRMDGAQLAGVTAHSFQRHPARRIEKARLIREMIDNERFRRRSHA